MPILFPAFRDYLEARRVINDDLVALIVGAHVASDCLSLGPQDRLLADLVPEVALVERMNQRVAAVRELWRKAPETAGRMGIFYIVSAYGVYLADAVSMLRDTGQDDDAHEPDDTHISTLHSRLSAASGIALPSRDLALFKLILTIRNRLAHQGGTPGSTLRSRWAQLDADAKEEWERVSKRPLNDVIGNDRDLPMTLGLGELNATLAVTHRLAHRVNRGLAEGLARTKWAELVVSDYKARFPRRYGDPTLRSRRLLGYSTKLYAALELTDSELDAATKKNAGLSPN